MPKQQGGTGGTTAPGGVGQTKGQSQPNKNPYSGLISGNVGGMLAAANPTPMPWDSAYEQSVGNARAKYNNALINAGLAQTTAQQEYGLDTGFNDYQANPYSRAALLEQSFQRANRGSTNSYASSGQLYAGSLSNALTANRSSYGESRDSLEKTYRAALQEIEDRKTQARNDMNDEIAGAGWDRVSAASAADLQPDTSPAPKPAQQKQAKPKNQPKPKGKSKK